MYYRIYATPRPAHGLCPRAVSPKSRAKYGITHDLCPSAPGCIVGTSAVYPSASIDPQTQVNILNLLLLGRPDHLFADLACLLLVRCVLLGGIADLLRLLATQPAQATVCARTGYDRCVSTHITNSKRERTTTGNPNLEWSNAVGKI